MITQRPQWEWTGTLGRVEVVGVAGERGATVRQVACVLNVCDS
jgi:hypothetical protein